jgi:hypothetical protein
MSNKQSHITVPLRECLFTVETLFGYDMHRVGTQNFENFDQLLHKHNNAANFGIFLRRLAFALVSEFLYGFAYI